MPRNRKARRNQDSLLQEVNVRKPFHERITIGALVPVTTIVEGSAQLSIPLTSNDTAWGARLQEFSDLYRLFRFVNMKVIMSHMSSNHGLMVALSMSNTFSSGNANAKDIAEMDQVGVVMPGAYEQITFNFPRASLKGVADWYVTEAGAAEPLLDTQGRLFITAFGNDGLAVAIDAVIFVQATVEFKERLDPAATQSRTLRRLKALGRIIPSDEDEKTEGESIVSTEAQPQGWVDLAALKKHCEIFISGSATPSLRGPPRSSGGKPE